MKHLLSVLTVIAMVGCTSPDSPAPKNGDDRVGSEKVTAKKDFILDGTSGLFSAVTWNTYDGNNHMVWSNFDIFGIKTGNVVRKFQILNYYNPQNTNASGYYTLRIQTSENVLQTIELDAQGCGNSFSNPNYDVCINDPDQNVFTYLDMKTMRIWKMRDQAAQVDGSWTLAFKRTQILMNNGVSGPGDVLGTLLYRDASLFDADGQPILPAVQAKARKKNDPSQFLTLEVPEILGFYPPEGSQTVITTPAWMNQGVVNSNSWWLLNAKSGSVAKFHVLSAVRSTTGGQDVYDVEIRYSVQKNGEASFGSELTYKFANLPTATGGDFCFDFEVGGNVDCAGTAWNLRLSAHPNTSGLGFLFSTGFGAIGPFDSVAAGNLKSWTN